MKYKHDKDMTHFGFKNIQKTKKNSMVSNIFDIVANKYDLMNDIMSFGIHRIWKHYTLQHSEVHSGNKVLDLAGGTGDLSIKFSKLVGNTGIVVLLDINYTMLCKGRDRLRNLGILNNIIYIQADAEYLPFPSNTFDCIAISFGLRNFTNKEKALFSVYRVLKPRGKLLILEFGAPTFSSFKKLYNLYSFNVLPKLGAVITSSHDSYQYLVESIRMNLDPETLKDIITQTGFTNASYTNLTGGIAVLYSAYKK
ncbi:bifunctional demethylmenaquinone methyltransferase/2-methoxy-6-polyprenyl-1,4-benzoquinol methylase UbiE [Candidatus Blochmannia ocreatus (nom. nud.)]|uniref:Ubiquinone/menaquinone biosynthesis C-methyltransferase UbiE n=1 Tax=Candidatus Blochmannia ocreatus (nom. nud.) TaxID=251538 RepID=A0ABY4SUE0_9ENTR|nr:bifunctional demethylmenaquinone methyltransferase/2-methoxy-6-polyprenyl-1,4-benzoquinol methylase UbiE [Candidatus Blochmannia ocreatus]URJ25088.1 bifunctional demethylmenaquinone methyltransferase/2-methoxy-6-polyprenyl-1,4-benzoquinol methylase UbiE [Candidatus Blochmannia ocreatus]